jgi:putative two-component system response regulator
VTAAGYEAVHAKNGFEALQVLRSGACKLVISDWEMPLMNGIELCRSVRSGDFGSYVYIIMLTGRDGEDDAVAGLEAGADEFITKPFRATELVARLRAGERILASQAQELTIFAMAKLAESRDSDTGDHLDRVQKYVRILAEDLARQPGYSNVIDTSYVRLLEMTSPLHDIGKVGIPDCVLLKPGRLSNIEFEIMKTHTTLGAQTLKAALENYPEAEFLKMACDIAGSHHERFDGTGYPLGLSGEKIPLCGRIMALADVYDALTTRRVYKAAFDHVITRAMIVEARGKQFDPAIVDAFIRQEPKFVQLQSRIAKAA